MQCISPDKYDISRNAINIFKNPLMLKNEIFKTFLNVLKYLKDLVADVPKIYGPSVLDRVTNSSK